VTDNEQQVARLHTNNLSQYNCCVNMVEICRYKCIVSYANYFSYWI